MVYQQKVTPHGEWEGAQLVRLSPSDVVATVASSVEQVHRQDPLARIWIVAPGVAAARQLTISVARHRPLANVTFLTPLDLARRVVSSTRTVKAEITSVKLRELVRNVISDSMPRELEKCRPLDLIDSFLRLIREVGDKPTWEQEEYRERSPFARELLACCDRIATGITHIAETADELMSEAARVLSDGDDGFNEIPQHVMWICHAPLRPHEQVLHDALVIPCSLRTLAVEIGHEAIDQDLRVSLFGSGEEINAVKPQRRDAQVVVVSDPATEVDVAIEALLDQGSIGAPFADMALLYSRTEPYASLCRERLRLAGVPYVIRDSTELTRSTTARFVRSLLRLASEPNDRDALGAWLSSAPMKSRNGEVARIDRWREQARQHRFRGGVTRWLQSLVQLTQARSHSSSGYEGDLVETQFREHLDDLSTHLAALPSTWTDWVRWVNHARSRFVGEPTRQDGWLPRDLLADEAIGAVLDELGELGSGIVDLETFTDSFEHGVAATVLPAEFASGVYVGSVDDAVGTPLRFAVCCGLNDGLFPSPGQQDGLLRAVSGPADLRPINDYRRTLWNVIEESETALLTCAQSDIRSQQGLAPSPLLLEYCSQKAGSVFSQEDLWENRDGYPWVRVVPSQEAMFAGKTAFALRATPAQQHVSTMLGENDGKRCASESLKRSWDVVREREDDRFGPRSGNVAQSTNMLSNVLHHDYSPTSLEGWATCPFRFFLSNVLDISQRDERDPDDRVESPLDLGSAIHRVLEIIVREHIESHEVQSSYRDVVSRVRLELNHVLDEYVSLGRIDPGEFLAERESYWVEQLSAFVWADITNREAEGLFPVAVEVAFGRDEQSPVTVDDRHRVRMHGHIDRIDQSRDGKRGRVWDYKATTFDNLADIDDEDNPHQSGTALQIDVYGLGAQSLFPSETWAGGYWSLRDREFGFRKKEVFLGEERRTAFVALVHAMVTEIESGVFPLVPRPWKDSESESNCRYCAYDKLCPPSRGMAWSAKSRDDALDGYRRITNAPAITSAKEDGDKRGES